MKIKTITCHRVYNYGASLQAYALQHYLEKLGHDVEIIDYWPEQFHRRYNLWYIPRNSKYRKIVDKLPFLRYPLGLLKNKGKLKTWGRKNAFIEFENKYLHITSTRYLTSDELKSDPPNADIYITGSDQVWNTDMENGRYPAYYLDFGRKEIKRVSYAASFGIPVVNDEYKDFVTNELKKIDQISVREKSGLKILDSLGIRGGVSVVDPVFLLSNNEWNKLSNYAADYGLQRNGYILVYDFLHNDTRIYDIASKLSKYKKLPIVSINDYSWIKYADKNINCAGPTEFLKLIQNASSVVCNSFHATAFSVLFSKEFYVYPLIGQRNSSRMKDFLFDIGLSDRCEKNEISEIDYSSAKNMLDLLIDKSKMFINNALQI